MMVSKAKKQEERRLFLKKAEVLKYMSVISNTLDNRGSIYIADVITRCMEDVSSNNLDNLPIALRKVGDLLDQKGEYDLAESVDELLPEILELRQSNAKSKPKKTKVKLSADKAYEMAAIYKKQYLHGEVDENSFEYSKALELEKMLKIGFLFPPPPSYNKFPSDSNNWWEHFKNGGNNGIK